MKIRIACLLIALATTSCSPEAKVKSSEATIKPIEGTWQLISGTIIENGDTTVTDYTKDISFIKIINATHFAFLKHDLNKGSDSTAVYVSGGGRYWLNDSLYTENLEYCSAREWEGNDFSFVVTVTNDTLIQTGVEQVEDLGVNRLNVEKYVRSK